MASEFVPSARRFSSIDGLRPLQANIIYGCPAHNLYVEVVHVIVCGRIMPGLSGSEAVHCAARVIHVVDSAWSVQTIQRPNGGPSLSQHWVSIVFLGVQSSPWRSLTPVPSHFPEPHTANPVSTIHWGNAGLVLGQRRRRWPNTSPALAQCIVFAGNHAGSKIWNSADLISEKLAQHSFIVNSTCRVRGPSFNFPVGPEAAGVFFKWIFWDWILMK